MPDLSLADRVVGLEPHPDAIADLFVSLYDALRSDGEDPDARRAAAGFSSEATRIVLNWMGRGESAHLSTLTDRLRRVLAERDATDPLRDVAPAARLAARVHDLARTAEVYRKSNNAARHVAALAGARRETWREVVKWAYAHGQPFSVADLKRGGFYERRRATAYEALDRLTEAGLLAKDAASDPALFSLTWEGRSACRALWSLEEIGRDGGAQPPSDEDQNSSVRALHALQQNLRQSARENAILRAERDRLEDQVRLLQRERSALATHGVLATRAYRDAVTDMPGTEASVKHHARSIGREFFERADEAHLWSGGIDRLTDDRLAYTPADDVSRAGPSGAGGPHSRDPETAREGLHSLAQRERRPGTRRGRNS